mmetsp:Transcript_12261/g.16552  ORF Transcript_12261/g.16552 Transcript_12261/m.16552 type:complete len:291 (+) Transcript_12261:46-918(+)
MDENNVHAEIKKRGVLKKLSRNRRHHSIQPSRWQKRDFVLAQTLCGVASLAYYDDKGKCKGAFKLEANSSISENKKNNVFVLNAVDENGPCSVKLAASSTNEMNAWILAIQDAITDHAASQRETTTIPIKSIPSTTTNQQKQDNIPTKNTDEETTTPSATTPQSKVEEVINKESDSTVDPVPLEKIITQESTDKNKDVVAEEITSIDEDDEIVNQQKRSTMTCQNAFLQQLMTDAAAEAEDHDDEASHDSHSNSEREELEERGTDSCRLDFLKRLGIVVAVDDHNDVLTT